MPNPTPRPNLVPKSLDSSFLLEELGWIEVLLHERFEKGNPIDFKVFQPPAVSKQTAYGKFISEHQMNAVERTAIGLPLLAYVDPSALQLLFDQKEKNFVMRCSMSGVLAPTGYSLMALVCHSKAERLLVESLFQPSHLFYRKSILSLGAVKPDFSDLSGSIQIAPTFRSLFLHNKENKPRFSSAFPASLVQTELEWDDLVLNKGTHNKLSELRLALQHLPELKKLHGARHIKSGLRVLFHGPSGTGKTLTTALLGKELQRDVYRVDLSAVVSKYIGETTKNLSALFNTAENKDWILFFDEGDALFGKRADATSSENKNVHYANQDIAYLLQRIEDFNGMIIIASNFTKNMDEAFYRRIEHSIHFGIPDVANRILLWEKMLPVGFSLPNSHPKELLAKHNFTAATISRIINKCCVLALSSQSQQITSEVLDKYLKAELLG